VEDDPRTTSPRAAACSPAMTRIVQDRLLRDADGVAEEP
jgi:hypothetical protein